MGEDHAVAISHGERVSRGRQRRFTSQQKLAILREWEKAGNGAEVARVHGIPSARLYGWKKQLEHGADEYLISGRPKKDAQVRELETENQKLKETVASMAQELMLLKKKMGLV
jgi:transposase-like protein